MSKILSALIVCAFGISNLPAQENQFYEPVVKTVEGWTVKVDPKLLAGDHATSGEEAIKALANHLQRIKWIVPAKRVKQLQSFKIWLEHDNPRLRNFQYHPSRRWLESNGHNPELEKHVHIGNAKKLLDPKMWAKHPYCVLHELAHAYHDQVLGWNDAEIKKAFQAAKKAKTYEKVLDHRGAEVQHYGLNNHKEYFAESTEAYFGVNDFYPFVRAELKKHDPQMFELMKKIWGKVD